MNKQDPDYYLVSLDCPRCGAPLPVKEETGIHQCDHCNTFAREKVSVAKKLSRTVQTAVVGGSTVEGIDVSRYQATEKINYERARSSHPFVFIKATEGASYKDPLFREHCDNAVNAGMHVGAYHFMRSNVSAQSQVNNILEAVMHLHKLLGYRPKIAIDVETVDGVSNSQRLNVLYQIIDGLRANYYNPGIYSSPGFANAYLTPVPSWINNCWQWVAHYTSASLPTKPSGWNNVVVWQYGIWDQYSWTTPVAGCSPQIDVNKFFGDEKAVEDFFGKAKAVDIIVDACKRPGTANVNVNLRSYPSTDSSTLIKTILKGETVTIYDSVSNSGGYDWYLVRDSKGYAGYCVSKYIATT